MRVDQVMHKDVPTLRPSDPLSFAAKILRVTGCGIVPVVAGDGSNRMVGTVTDREICIGTYRHGLPASEIFVGSVMTHHVHACTPATMLEDAVLLMDRTHVEWLPVVDGTGQLLGIVSYEAGLAENTREEGGGWHSWWRRWARLVLARTDRAGHGRRSPHRPANP